MSEDRPTMADILRANRAFIMAVLSTPLMGMVVAIGLIFYLEMERALLYVAIIFFLIVQYSVLLVYIHGRFNAIINKDK